jgi:glycosyltransferase involved in cell wall biosynthesis
MVLMPTVSICIPAYNRKEYLRHTLDSVFAQTYKDYEVIVVDDGSTDGTQEMVSNTGYNVRYYWQENRGEPATCNRLIELAEGKYVSFIHSDDPLVPDAIERMVNVVNA